jgi:hypothetical protein
MVYITETKVVDGVCPSFSGFYETAWGGDWECHLTSESEHFGIDINFDYLNFDQKKYQESIAKYYAGEVETELVDGGFITSMKFQKVKSPKYYNYSTDQIYVEIIITNNNYAKIVEYIEDHNEDFQDYLTAKFTSSDGFCPLYSNEAKDWYKTLVADNLKSDETQISCILEFIYDNECDTKEDYDHVADWGGNNSLCDYYTFDEKATPSDVLEAIKAKDDE